MASSGIPLSEWSGSGATHELHETIRKQIDATNKQSETILKLTWATVFLGVVQVLATIVQLIISFR